VIVRCVSLSLFPQNAITVSEAFTLALPQHFLCFFFQYFFLAFLLLQTFFPTLLFSTSAGLEGAFFSLLFLPSFFVFLTVQARYILLLVFCSPFRFLADLTDDFPPSLSLAALMMFFYVLYWFFFFPSYDGHRN